MTDKEDVKIVFPTDYFIKIMMNADDDTRSYVLETLKFHIEGFDQAAVKIRPSSKGTFESWTVNFWAKSEAHVMGTFEDLNKHSGVKMVL